ncbi:ogr/Delta-like zinc finger family protein [Celerinatantimonas sp. MCCC 1A17872]|uniref:ogr/Delta-like zinc finger family protein n=1 Tax=Celerinatantimonas sp. MCCC 1A17872 TaxID=3177514 RepID=UPI0038C51EDB
MSVYRFVCPHCHKTMRVRTSEGMSELVRTMYLQCTNEACGATYRAIVEITHQLSPSGTPNPEILLPAANDNIRREAMQDDTSTTVSMEVHCA